MTIVIKVTIITTHYLKLGAFNFFLLPRKQLIIDNIYIELKFILNYM